MEPLTEAVRMDSNIYGFEIGLFMHKISLFVNDVFLFLTNVESSLFNILHMLKLYGSFSSYKIYLDKSEILPLLDVNNDTIKHKFPLNGHRAGLNIWVYGWIRTYRT